MVRFTLQMNTNSKSECSLWRPSRWSTETRTRANRILKIPQVSVRIQIYSSFFKFLFLTSIACVSRFDDSELYCDILLLSVDLQSFIFICKYVRTKHWNIGKKKHLCWKPLYLIFYIIVHLSNEFISNIMICDRIHSYQKYI